MTQETAPIAVSLGDPAGVGPELLIAAWSQRAAHMFTPFFAVGGVSLLTAAAQQHGIPVAPISSPGEAYGAFPDALPVLVGCDGDYQPGAPSPEGARVALSSLTEATQLAVSGQACAVVTGPIAKSRLAEVGFSHPGQTEFVAVASGKTADDAVMMLAGPRLRTVPLTVHNALAEVPDLLTSDVIRRKSRIIAAALKRDFGMDHPRLAIAALNPHAGEDGRFGDEEARIIAPAITTLRDEGYHVSGPHPADAMFAAHERERYDVAICMYHDQALIPLKALDFDEGVNVTLGLPIIRTSPDHGTAFGIAGKGIANAGATIAALRMAGTCAKQRARS